MISKHIFDAEISSNEKSELGLRNAPKEVIASVNFSHLDERAYLDLNETEDPEQ